MSLSPTPASTVLEQLSGPWISPEVIVWLQKYNPGSVGSTRITETTPVRPGKRHKIIHLSIVLMTAQGWNEREWHWARERYRGL